MNFYIFFYVSFHQELTGSTNWPAGLENYNLGSMGKQKPHSVGDFQVLPHHKSSATPIADVYFSQRILRKQHITESSFQFWNNQNHNNCNCNHTNGNVCCFHSHKRFLIIAIATIQVEMYTVSTAIKSFLTTSILFMCQLNQTKTNTSFCWFAIFLGK